MGSVYFVVGNTGTVRTKRITKTLRRWGSSTTICSFSLSLWEVPVQTFPGETFDIKRSIHPRFENPSRHLASFIPSS